MTARGSWDRSSVRFCSFDFQMDEQPRVSLQRTIARSADWSAHLGWGFGLRRPPWVVCPDGRRAKPSGKCISLSLRRKPRSHGFSLPVEGQNAKDLGNFGAWMPPRDAQDSGPLADAFNMLRRISEPLPLTEASLLVLRPAMNAPVLNVEFLPVGPARAAVIVFAEEYGGFGLALGIRSNESGQVAVFRNREPMDDSVPIGDVLEPALAHAERMGFLFDEDMVAATPGEQGRAQAKALWGRLTGEIELPPPPKAVTPRPGATDPVLELDEPVDAAESPAPVLVLDDEISPPPAELSLDQEVAPEPPAVEAKSKAKAKKPAARKPELTPPTAPPVRGSEVAKPKKVARAAKPAAPAAEPAPPPKPRALPPSAAQAATLSKFRQAEPDPAASASGAADAGNALGRIPLVRVRRGGNDAPKRVPYLARLLSSF